MKDELNLKTEEFRKELSFAFRLISSKRKSKEPLSISRTASTLAIIYESARNAVEFRAEHLIRQAAIERILKRRLFLNQKSERLAHLLVKELLWARYIKPESIPIGVVEEIALVIEKYRVLLSASKGVDKLVNGLPKRVLEIASCEIEEKIAFDPLPQVIINYAFETLSGRIDFDEPDPEVKSIQIYIAVERGFGKNSDGLIVYKLLKTLIPSWFGRQAKVQELKDKFFETLSYVESQLNYPLGHLLKREVVFLSPPFNLLYEMINTYGVDFVDLISDKDSLEKTIRSTLEDLYRETKDKLSRASVRSIVYIFLTKMVVGILLELPIDLLFGKVNYIALGVNLVFPPLLMFLLNLDVDLPDEENTERMVDTINEYFYLKDKPKAKIVSLSSKTQKINNVFGIFYLVMFIVTFGGVIWILTKLGFNPVSQVIFLFFLSVVSFFAYRVRGIAKDFSLQKDERESLISSLKDFIFLPVIKVGQWLSAKIASINVLSFILDFIIEAPLKVFLEVIEEWIHFIKAKKEEIVS